MSSFLLPCGAPKTVIVTGGAGGIGAQTIRTFHAHGCNVVIADLPFASGAAESLISSLSDPNRALFHETDITDWEAMRDLFRTTKERFSQVDIVIANAGLMESRGFFDFDEDENGELKEPTEAYKIIDVNLKGSMNSATLPSLITFRGLTYNSTQTSDTCNAVKSTRCRWITRLSGSHCFDIWLLWRHRCGIVHLIQARCCWSGSVITAESERAGCPSQCSGAVLHSYVYYYQLLGKMEREGTTSKHCGGRC